MRLRTLIVDDEPLARRGLALRLARHPDVQMPGVDGFELVRAVPSAQMPITVFVTAYDQYALKAFEANALDYLLKPVEDARLDSALDRVRHELSTRDADEHRGRLLRLLGTMSGRPDLTL